MAPLRKKISRIISFEYVIFDVVAPIPIFSGSKRKDEVLFMVLLHSHNCNIAGTVLLVVSEILQSQR